MVTGGSQRENFGTLLTPELMQWVVDKLSENLDIAGGDPTGQSGQRTRPGQGTGSRDWRPQNRGQNRGVGGYSFTDIVSVMKKTCNGTSTYMVGFNDGNTVQMDEDQWQELS